MAELREYNGKGEEVGRYALSPSAPSSPPTVVAVDGPAGGSATDRRRRPPGGSLSRLFSDLFLPAGHPATTAEGYLHYQICDSIQGLCSYLRGVVAAGAALAAAGVGDGDATAMGAAVTWAVRDGLGMLGGLAFSYYASSKFDGRVKEYRLLADVANDAGMTLDMAMPHLLARCRELALRMPAGASSRLPPAYLALASASALCKVVCGTCAGATKGSITDHFAVRGNRADVQAKEGAQETLVSLVGMVLGVWLARALQRMEGDDEGCGGEDGGENVCPVGGPVVSAQAVSWTVFLVLTWVHVYANYVGIQKLKLRTLNRERAAIVLRPAVERCCDIVLSKRSKAGDDDDATTEAAIRKSCREVPGPDQISESLSRSMWRMLLRQDIRLGASMNEVRSSGDGRPTVLESERYMFLSASREGVAVALEAGSATSDELKAYAHAMVVRGCLRRDESSGAKELILKSHRVVNRLFANGEVGIEAALAERGWDVSRVYLEGGPFRYKMNKKEG